MDHFKRGLISATFDQLTKSQHEVLGWAAARMWPRAWEAGRWFPIGAEIGYAKGLQHSNQFKRTHVGRSSSVAQLPRN